MEIFFRSAQRTPEVRPCPSISTIRIYSSSDSDMRGRTTLGQQPFDKTLIHSFHTRFQLTIITVDKTRIPSVSPAECENQDVSKNHEAA